ncbi:MAG: 6,7-dimethyl-8-ribityllumazine synthase [Cyanobacteria bacterium J003]|nr:MAG: 6,7-dimethyl-8-ribityllumazine synthase [Cyanobacteria bacterium J003]
MAVFEGTYQVLGTPRFGIVISRFNDLITTKLLEGCQDCLRRHGIDPNPHGSQVDYAWVPGSFEIPLVAAQLAASRRYAAIICLGAIIRGQTPHFDYVAAEVTKGIATASMQTGVPIIYGILTTDTMQQALERAGIKSNKGWEYALNALEMATLMQTLPSAINPPTTKLSPVPVFSRMGNPKRSSRNCPPELPRTANHRKCCPKVWMGK